MYLLLINRYMKNTISALILLTPLMAFSSSITPKMVGENIEKNYSVSSKACNDSLFINKRGSIIYLLQPGENDSWTASVEDGPYLNGYNWEHEKSEVIAINSNQSDPRKLCIVTQVN